MKASKGICFLWRLFILLVEKPNLSCEEGII